VVEWRRPRGPCGLFLACLVGCVLALAGVARAEGDSRAGGAVTQWAPHEITFTSEGDYANPYTLQDQPLLTVIFEHAQSGTRIGVEGFWDGARTWRARFAPARVGLWRWRAESSDGGMNGKVGALTCVAPTEEQIAANPNYRGHIRVGPTGRYFVYADGTPFFWLGDTLWAMNTRRCGLGSNAEGPFYAWLRDRKAKGFTVVVAQYFPSDNGQPNEEGHAFAEEGGGAAGKFARLNPEYFQALDRRVEALWEAGFVLAAHPSWISENEMTLADCERISRYLLARYGAYDLVWSLSGEYQFSYRQKSPPWTAAEWRTLGQAVEGWNVFGHPVSVHPDGRSSSNEFHNEGWLDHNWIQSGQGTWNLWRVGAMVAEDYARVPPKPVVEAEGWYENHRNGSAVCQAVDVRLQAWAALLNGAAGCAYGASGVWQFYDPEDPESAWPPWDKTPWEEALRYEGSGQMKHLRDFFAAFEWWRLEPHRDWARIGKRAPEATNLGDPHCAAEPGKRCVVYIPSGNEGRRVRVLNLAGKAYRATWFNPRDGSSAAIAGGGAINTSLKSAWTAPPVPDNGDWVLRLETT